MTQSRKIKIHFITHPHSTIQFPNMQRFLFFFIFFGKPYFCFLSFSFSCRFFFFVVFFFHSIVMCINHYVWGGNFRSSVCIQFYGLAESALVYMSLLFLHFFFGFFSKGNHSLLYGSVYVCVCRFLIDIRSFSKLRPKIYNNAYQPILSMFFSLQFFVVGSCFILAILIKIHTLLNNVCVFDFCCALIMKMKRSATKLDNEMKQVLFLSIKKNHPKKKSIHFTGFQSHFIGEAHSTKYIRLSISIKIKNNYIVKKERTKKKKHKFDARVFSPIIKTMKYISSNFQFHQKSYCADDKCTQKKKPRKWFEEKFIFSFFRFFSKIEAKKKREKKMS